MKVLSRDFTRKEKLLIALLLLILAALAYYQFLDQPVRQGIASAQAEQESLRVELEAVNAKIKTLEKMRRELEELNGAEAVSLMPSYNNSKAELALLNDILEGNVIQYSVSFSDVTRKGDQIRQNFSIQFSTRSYSEMQWVLEQLANSPYRCLIGDIRCTLSTSWNKTLDEELTTINVSATATFFETMVGGSADAGLPADKTQK